MVADRNQPFQATDRVQHVGTGLFGTVQRCEKSGLTTYLCAVIFDIDLQTLKPGRPTAELEQPIAATDLELVRRGGIRLVVDNTAITPARHACLNPVVEHPLHRRAGLPAPVRAADPPSAGSPGQAPL